MDQVGISARTGDPPRHLPIAIYVHLLIPSRQHSCISVFELGILNDFGPFWHIAIERFLS